MTAESQVVAGRVSMSDANVTQLLRATASGDRRQLDALMHAIYQDLHRLAASHLQRERSDHTLQPTALVHEAYLKLIDQRTTNWNDRVHFFAVASQIIRRILVDHARERLAAKRGRGRRRVSLDEAGAAAAAAEPEVDILSLDDALRQLAAIDETQARIVELRYFSGLTIEEVAEHLGIGRRSVDRDWRCAKAWLFCRLADETTGAGDER
ncbi:MAG: sigma-70 family RNA polymerase sigma factor [Phycisphaerales bacterium]|nr:sigma-70 family RNA polymerase sigma factor [Phycisphaerales bacterium]